MKIVLAGYPKTGTKTSTAALEILGFNTGNVGVRVLRRRAFTKFLRVPSLRFYGPSRTCVSSNV